MSIDGFPFEGRDVTAAQLKRQGITYSEGVIQSALEAGCQSVADLIAHCETRADLFGIDLVLASFLIVLCR